MGNWLFLKKNLLYSYIVIGRVDTHTAESYWPVVGQDQLGPDVSEILTRPATWLFLCVFISGRTFWE